MNFITAAQWKAKDACVLKLTGVGLSPESKEKKIMMNNFNKNRNI